MSELSERFLTLRHKILESKYSHLNEPQREAVFTTEGPLLILAGAGSGKTTVLINRAACLLRYGSAYYSEQLPGGLSEGDVAFLQDYLDGKESGEDAEAKANALLRVNVPQPWQIMTITFTNKAAGELKQRLGDMLGEKGCDIWAMTFHASCARILRRDAERLGFTSRFTIYDTDDQKRMIKSVMQDLNIDTRNMTEKSVMAEISRAKDRLMSPSQFEATVGSDYRLLQISQIYTAYQKKLRLNDAMDFDDLLYNTVALFEQESEVLEYYQRRFRYIMVDEYQDTNYAQYRLIKLLAGGEGNLCVVGDDDQSIYKFRGATIENILNFEKHYPDARIIRLEQNYRSTTNILDAANSVIANNAGRHEKKLWSANEAGEQVNVFSADSEYGEADYIVARVGEWVTGGGHYSDCAVLYRMSALSNVIENKLMRAEIPYKVVAGRKFYDRKEIRDAIAYLSVINNPADEVRLARIINEPKRGIGAPTVRNASEIATGLGISTFEVLGTADQYALLTRSSEKLMGFHDMMTELIELEEDDELPLAQLLEETLQRTGYIKNLLANDVKSAERIENLRELESSLSRYQEERGEEATLQGFLEEVALITDIDAMDENADCVSLMTLHAAKGLEFPMVFIAGVENGIFPSNLTLESKEELEEDRRLAYVGITRAKKSLHLMHCSHRTMFGHTVRNMRSMYIDEIDPALIKQRGGHKPRPTETFEQRKKQPPKVSETVVNAHRISINDTPQRSGEQFCSGDTVRHRIFGEGTVLSAKSMGNDTLLEIDFGAKGTKKLMANFAGLKKQ